MVNETGVRSLKSQISMSSLHLRAFVMSDLFDAGKEIIRVTGVLLNGSTAGLSTSLRAKRSNPSCGIKKEWIASSQELLAMTMWWDFGNTAAGGEPTLREFCPLD
jgi:hypothetical protein